MSTERLPLSVVVLTRDEREFVGRCLDAVWWADEVLVVDSGSTDGTLELARERGARVLEQPWLGYAAQRNLGIARARHDWVLFLDADELPDTELAAALRALDLPATDPSTAFSVDRRGDWFGVLLRNDQRRALRHSFVRLFHRGTYGYDPDVLVHERVVVPPERVVDLPGVLLHWRAATVDDYQLMLNRYAGLESAAALAGGSRPGFARVLLMPLLRFFWIYLARGSVTYGRRGLLHAIHATQAEYVRQLKAYETQHLPRVPDPPAAYRPEGRPPA